MNKDNSTGVIIMWRDAVKRAEDRCDVHLHEEIESYLVSLLIRFTNQPELASKVMAQEFLRAMQEKDLLRRTTLAEVGDQCLLFSGLFPGAAEKRLVTVGYFVDIGRSAYSTISNKASDLYGNLAVQFVTLMDVLQSLNERHVLLPFEAYSQWQELGSARSYHILHK